MKKDFFKEYGFRIVFVVFFLLAFVWMGTKQTILSNSNSVEDWLPAQFQQTRDYRWYLENFPFESYVVVSWEGCEMGDDRIELFAQKLVPEQTIDNFSLSGVDETFKADLQLDRAPEGVRDLPDSFVGDANLSTQALVEAGAAENRKEETPEVKEEPSFFKSVMTGPRLARLLTQTYERMQRRRSDELYEVDEEGVTVLERSIRERLKGTLIGPDGKSTAMIVTLNQGKRDGKSLQAVLNKIRELAAESGLPNTLEIRTGSFAAQMVKSFGDLVDEIANGRKIRMDGAILGGPPVDNVALTKEGERTLYRLAGICAIVGVTIAFICLRSVRLTMFVFWIAALSAGVALAFVSLTGGTCDTILLSMPALVYVLGMSGAVHLINYYHDAIREGGLDGATERAVRHGFTPCFFAQLTTALGLGSLFAGRLVPITKFGFYSAIGVLATLLLLFLYLPALLYFYPSKKFAAKYGGKGEATNKGKLYSFWNFFGGLIIKRHNVVVVLCFALMGFFGYYLPQIKTSVKMMSFFAPEAEIIKNYEWLEEKLGPLVPMELVVCFDNQKLNGYSFQTPERLELINQISDQLKAELSEDVGGTLSVGLFAPDASETATPGGTLHRTLSTVVGKTIEDNRTALRDYLTIEGNPTIDELADFLTENAAKKREAAEKRRREFDERLAAENAQEDAPRTYDDFIAMEQDELDESLAPHYADFTSIKSDFDEVERLELEASVFSLNKDYLAEQKVCDLLTLLETANQGRPFRKLSLEEVDALKQGANRWQNERGIELWRVSIRVWSLKKDIDYSAFIENVKNVVEPILAEKSLELEARRQGLDADATEKKFESARAYVEQNLPEESKSFFKSKKNVKDVKALSYEYALKDLSEQERQELSNSMGEAHTDDWIYPVGLAAKYTGMVPLVYKTQHELIKGLTSSLVMAFVLIMFVFVFLLRSIPAGFIAMIPNIFPVIVVFGFMAWSGVLVDVGTMMTASVALGVAVDDTMHYLTWFNDGVAKGQEPKVAALNAYRRCATAMTQSTLIAGFGLFSFSFSTFVPTQRFGTLMLAILFAAEFGDLVFLPALLTCKPFGRFFLNRRRSIKATDEELKKAEASLT